MSNHKIPANTPLRDLVKTADPELRDPVRPATSAELARGAALITNTSSSAWLSKPAWLGLVAASAVVVAGVGALVIPTLNPVSVNLTPAEQPDVKVSQTTTPEESTTPTPEPSAPTETKAPEPKTTYNFKAPRTIKSAVKPGEFSPDTRTVKTPVGTINVTDLRPGKGKMLRTVLKNNFGAKDLLVHYVQRGEESAAFSITADGGKGTSAQAADFTTEKATKLERKPQRHHYPIMAFDMHVINKASWTKIATDPKVVTNTCSSAAACEGLHAELADALGENILDSYRRTAILTGLTNHPDWQVAKSTIAGAPGISFSQKPGSVPAAERVTIVVNPANGFLTYHQRGEYRTFRHRSIVPSAVAESEVKHAGTQGAWVSKMGAKDVNDCVNIVTTSNDTVECVR